jgi:hypothetical protein
MTTPCPRRIAVAVSGSIGSSDRSVEYEAYFNEARPHHEIGQKIPGKQPAVAAVAKPIVPKPVLGGLHHDLHLSKGRMMTVFIDGDA